MFDVITFGSATQDIFLELPESGGGNEKKLLVSDTDSKRYFCLPLGGKVLVDEMQFFSGGGGTNVACSLANLGLKIAYCGKIGDDAPGKVILNDLAKFGVSSKLCLKEKKTSTAISFVISYGEERIILIYKGACHFLTKSDIQFNEIKKTEWFYLAPFYEKTSEMFSVLINFAKENKIKVFANPSIEQIEKNDQDFLQSLSKVDILLLNKEEALILAKSPSLAIEDLGKIIKKICPGIIIITQGNNGAVVFDEENLYRAGIYKVAVKDKTGAGDSFGAGFLAGLLKENNIEYAIRLAIINSAKNVNQKGAKTGLLNKADLKILPNVDIMRERAY